MPNERPNFMQRMGNSWNNFRQRQTQGARNATPGSGHPRWYIQALDMITEPIVQGNFFDSQNGERGSFQMPGMDAARGMGNGIRNLFGGGARPGFTPAPGMGIMPNPAGYQPPQPQGEGIDIQPDIEGTLPQGQGMLRTHAAPPPRQRPSLNAFTVMREAPGAAAIMAHLAAMNSEQNRRRQR